MYALSVFSVESIYYHPEIQRRLAERHSTVTGGKPDALVTAAKTAALEAIEQHIKRLSERLAEKTIREKFFQHIPKKEDIAAATSINISIDVAAVVASEAARLRDALGKGDILSIMNRYPIRETAALRAIATKLGFQNRMQYEGAVRKLLMDDESALKSVRTLFGSLPTEISAT